MRKAPAQILTLTKSSVKVWSRSMFRSLIIITCVQPWPLPLPLFRVTLYKRHQYRGRMRTAVYWSDANETTSFIMKMNKQKQDYSRQLCKPSTLSQVCITVLNSPNPFVLISGYANTENIFYCLNVNYIVKAIQVKQLLFDLNCFFSVSKGPPFPKFCSL